MQFSFPAVAHFANRIVSCIKIFFSSSRDAMRPIAILLLAVAAASASPFFGGNNRDGGGHGGGGGGSSYGAPSTGGDSYGAPSDSYGAPSKPSYDSKPRDEIQWIFSSFYLWFKDNPYMTSAMRGKGVTKLPMKASGKRQYPGLVNFILAVA